MRNQTAIFLLFCLFILLSACTASEKTVGNSVEKTYDTALSKLKSGNTSQKQITALSTALGEMIQSQMPLKDSLLQTNQLADKEKAFEMNQYLLFKIFPALPYVDKTYQTTFEKLKTEEQTLQTEFQSFYLEQGKSNLAEALAKGDKEKSKLAYEAFGKAIKYGIEASEVKELQQKSLDFSTIIYHVTIEAPMDRQYQILLEDKFRDVENINRKFKKIYFKRENLENVDCTLKIVLDPLHSHVEDRSNSRNFERSVQTGSTSTTDANGNSKESPVFEKVSATLTENTKAKIFRWNTVINIQSNSPNCTLTSSQFQESFENLSTRISISGDERAIPENYRMPEEQMMTDQEAVEQLIEQIYDRIQLTIL